MPKQGLEKEEEPEIILPTLAGSCRKQGNFRKTPVSVSMTTQKAMDHKKLWKALREMGIPDHLTYLLRNLYAGQKATVKDLLYGTSD